MSEKKALGGGGEWGGMVVGSGVWSSQIGDARDRWQGICLGDWAASRRRVIKNWLQGILEGLMSLVYWWCNIELEMTGNPGLDEGLASDLWRRGWPSCMPGKDTRWGVIGSQMDWIG